MSLASETSRVAGGGKDALKIIIQKLGVTVSDEKIDEYANLASGISEKILPGNLIDDEVGSLYGLSGSPTVKAVLSWIGNYAKYWWRRRVYETIDTPTLGPVGKRVLSNGSKSTKDTVRCSDNIILSSSGKIELENPQNVLISWNNADETAPTVRGKYSELGVLSGNSVRDDAICYIPPDAEYTKASSATGASTWPVQIDAQVVLSINTLNIGEWELVSSTDRSAYPDDEISGGYQYQYLGNPFENFSKVPTFVEFGSYTGTGTYGEENPSKLILKDTFGALIILDSVDKYFAFISSGFGMRINFDSGSIGYLNVLDSEGEKYASWYYLSAATQLNVLNREYQFIHIPKEG